MNLGQLFQTVIQIVKTDELKVVLPALAGFFTTVAANPTEINVVVALAKFNQDVISAQPNIAQDVLKQIASVMTTTAQALLAAPAKPAPQAK